MIADIPAYALGGDVSIQAARYAEANKWDQTSAITVTMRMEWDEYTDGNNQRWAAIDQYVTWWDRFDPTYSWSNARLKASCYAHYPDNSFCNQSKLYTAGSNGVPVSGQPYYQYTMPWRGEYVSIAPSDGLFNESDITITRSSSTWTLHMIVCIGGDQWTGGCDLQQ